MRDPAEPEPDPPPDPEQIAALAHALAGLVVRLAALQTAQGWALAAAAAAGWALGRCAP